MGNNFSALNKQMKSANNTVEMMRERFFWCQTKLLVHFENIGNEIRKLITNARYMYISV